MGFIKPNNNSGGSGGGLTPQELSRLNNAYTHSKSEHAPTTAEQNVQPDWNETDTTSDAYIKNKPDLSQIGSGGNIPSVTQIEPQELDMPKVFFYGNALPTTKDNVNLTMDYISNTTKFSSFIKLKCQGTSSMSYAKKNFTINMYSDEARATKLKKDFKGWGAQSKFCLKANYVDTTHTRNLSGARIAYDMVASRPDSEFKQQLLQCPRNGAVDGFPIKLYFNGEFYGIYTWNIPKDTWMFNMDKSNPNHIVLCAEKNTDGNSSAINSCQFRQLWTNGDGQDWSVEVGTMSEDLRTKFNRVIAFVMNATDQEFHDNISEYFDLYSLLDYYCFSYLTCHLDGLAKNMLMVTYDGVIWGACLYDMDSIYGVSWNGASFVSPQYQCPEQYQEQFSRLWVRIEQCFATELYARYLELRQGALSLSNIIKHVEEIYDVIPDRVFADEKAKWTSLPNVNTNTMTRFRNYMRDRAVYVDAQMLEIGTPQSSVECTGISLDKTELALGVFEGGAIDDSNKNYLENVAWELGTLNGNTANYSLANSTTDYRCQLTDLPVGTYTLHHDTYTYKKLGLNDNGICIIGTNASGSNDTNDITFNITNPNTTVDISVFSNGVTPSGVTLTRADISDIQEYSFEYTTINSPSWASSVDNNYLVIELIAGSTTDVDRNKLINICIGNDKYYISNTGANTSTSIITLSTKCLSSQYQNNIYVCIAIPKSKYGNTLDEFKTYCSSNGITNIYINKDIQSISGMLSAQLIATVTPENCTQSVVWSVSPEGIVTVDNGLVTAVANGQATVTVTCGSYSDTCVVTVSGMSESGGGNTNNYVTDSLYAYYDLTQLSTEATTVEDLSGNNNTFNVVSGTLTKDDLGGLVYNNNTNTPLINSNSFNPQTAEASIEYTFKYTGENNCTNPNNFTNRTCGINGDNGQGYYCWLGGFGYVIFKGSTNIISDRALPSTLINGEYYHVVCTFGDSEAKMYLNGELLATHTHNATGIPSNCTYYLGNSTNLGAPAQVLYSSRFYNKALTQDEITQNYTYEFTKLGLISGGDTGTNPNLVFQVNSTSMNTTDNTLTDNIAGISATLVGNPTVSDNQIAFTANDTFNFNISSLNLTSSNRTVRIKFTPTTLDNSHRNVIGIGESTNLWNNLTSSYINSSNLRLQHGSNHFSNVTTSSGNGSDNSNRLPASPVTGQEYEIVISENINGNVRWFVNGTLVQDGTTILFNPLYISNTEGTSRFIGSYSLIEIYNEYCNNYTEFTNMINNA